MSKNEEFFDDDGNLIATSWGFEERKRREREESEKREQALLEERKEINKRMLLEDRASQMEEKRLQDQKKRKIKDTWMSMPGWIKAMPKTPLTDPPTEGKKEKALYALTKKVTLTDEELERRKAQLYRIKVAMQDYESIHRRFPSGTPLAPITVVSLSDDAGGTTVSRSLSSAIQQSRNDLGSVITIDYAHAASDLGYLYGTFGKENTKKKVSLRHVIRQIDALQQSHFTPQEIFAIGGQNELYLDNHAEASKRVEVGVQDAVKLYKFMRETEGVCIFDCDTHNMDALMVSAIISHIVIFVVPLEKDAPQKLEQLLHTMKTGMKPQDYDFMVKNALLVFSAKNPAMSEKANRVKILRFLQDIQTSTGILREPVFIPYDKGVKKVPFHIANMKFSTAHVLRGIAGKCIDTILQKVG